MVRNASFIVVALQLFMTAEVMSEETVCSGPSQMIDDPQTHQRQMQVPSDFGAKEDATLSTRRGNGGVIALTKDLFEIPLPPDLPQVLNTYLEKMGILPLFEDIALPDVNDESPYEIGDTDDLTSRGYHWWLERSSVSHVLAPENDISYRQLLAVMKDGGFDSLLQQIGDFFPDINTLTVYHASIHGMAYPEIVRSGSSTFTLIVPIVLPDDADQNPNDHGGYHYNISSGLLMTNRAYDAVEGIALVLGIGEDIQKNDVLFSRNHRYPTFDSLDSVHWSRADASRQLPEHAVSAGDFVLEELEPSQIEPLRWAGNPSETVAEYAHQVGLPEELTPTLLEYCDNMGITAAFKRLLVDGNGGSPLKPGRSKNTSFKWTKWYIQRPEVHWNSNMHWISPSDKKAQDHYLKALSRGGFDQVLDAIGKKFNREGLTAYHITFIGVSHCELGYDHYDFSDTGGAGFNVIIPLILADSTDPELDVHNDLVAGSYKYQMGVASLIGDDCHHATSPVDYRPLKQMRMAATIYVADINEDNVESIMENYTQKYPPKGNTEFLLSMAGAHWKRDDQSVTLPR